MKKKKLADSFSKKIKAYALKNALEHEGKARIESVLNALFHEGLKKEQIKSVLPKIKKTVEEINSLDIEKQKQLFKEFEREISRRKERTGLPELPEAEKGVITRFAPSPSGPLHIGHVATGMPSSLYVKKYGGKFYIRIEDTNPKNIAPEAYEMIEKEAKWVFGNVHAIIVQSDRLEHYYRYAEELIKKGFAYICTCEAEKFRELKKSKKECPCRNLPVTEQMDRWKKMLHDYKEGEAVLRFKSSMQLENPSLRDFPLARIIEKEHPRQGKKYRVWPLMSFSVAVDDIEYGITHVIRAKEHRDSAKRQEMIYKALGKKFPYTFFLGRYKFKDLEISCTKIRKLIQERKFSGWDDIRLPFLASLEKRGYQPEAFEKMAEVRGLSEVDKVISKEDYFELLDNFNREILKEKALPIETSETQKQGFEEVRILMPDATEKRIYAKIQNIKDNDIVYFKGLGYAKLNKDIFWFCHR
ncbi:MAG: glutamate--tRNA ligase family protein [Candidatus Pacearchaeota archaeon]|nr:glutamate--tRNA ligase family protein [Candidatus Pacearchaeota archaeon]